jgi:hypothetical protein
LRGLWCKTDNIFNGDDTAERERELVVRATWARLPTAATAAIKPGRLHRTDSPERRLMSCAAITSAEYEKCTLCPPTRQRTGFGVFL